MKMIQVIWIWEGGCQLRDTDVGLPTAASSYSTLSTVMLLVAFGNSMIIAR